MLDEELDTGEELLVDTELELGLDEEELNSEDELLLDNELESDDELLIDQELESIDELLVDEEVSSCTDEELDIHDSYVNKAREPEWIDAGQPKRSLTTSGRGMVSI